LLVVYLLLFLKGLLAFDVVAPITYQEQTKSFDLQAFLPKLDIILKQNQNKRKLIITLKNLDVSLSSSDKEEISLLAKKHNINKIIFNIEKSKLEHPKAFDLVLGGFKLSFAAVMKYQKYYSKMDPTSVSFYILALKELVFEVFFSFYSQSYLNLLKKVKDKTNKVVVYGINYTRKIVFSTFDRVVIFINSPELFVEDPVIISAKFLWSLLTSEAFNTITGTSADVATILSVEKGIMSKNKARYVNLSLDLIGIPEKAFLLSGDYQSFYITFVTKSVLKLGYYVYASRKKTKDVLNVNITNPDCQILLQNIRRELGVDL
jgi:hypothetical protein